MLFGLVACKHNKWVGNYGMGCMPRYNTGQLKTEKKGKNCPIQSGPAGV